MTPIVLTEVRSYAAKTQQKAMKEFVKDSEKMADAGYHVQSQSWAQGQSGCLRFVLLGPFAFFIKPKGSLAVVYVREMEKVTP